MFCPVSRTIFRWSTPDPSDNWLMNGHLALAGESAILIDPPNVPGLIDSVSRLGKFESVILTTGDHFRGTSYFENEYSVKVYVPKQGENDIDPAAIMRIKHLKNAVFFDEGDLLPGGIRPFRARVEGRKSAPSLDEVMLLTKTGELLAGDIAMGSSDGKLLTRNEFFYPSPDPADNTLCLQEISRIIKASGARSLLSSHGFDILDKLQEALSARSK